VLLLPQHNPVRAECNRQIIQSFGAQGGFKNRWNRSSRRKEAHFSKKTPIRASLRRLLQVLESALFGAGLNVVGLAILREHNNLMSTNVDQNLSFIFGRRSIRAYAPGPVSDDAVQKLLGAAMAAPSAAGADPWRFVVVRNRDTLLHVKAALPYGQMLASAALGIVVCGDLEAAHDRQLSYLLQDCAAAIENLLLCAHVLGLGACWLGVHPREERVKRLQEILELPASILPVAAIAIGHPAETKEPRTRFNRDYVRLDKW
jgi:nitroreductase